MYAWALESHIISLHVANAVITCNGPCFLLFCASNFISCSVLAQLLPFYLLFANGTGGVGIF